MEDAKKLADEHWIYVGALLESVGAGDDLDMRALEYQYKSAFIHGYKHGVESTQGAAVNLSPKPFIPDLPYFDKA